MVQDLRKSAELQLKKSTRCALMLLWGALAGNALGMTACSSRKKIECLIPFIFGILIHLNYIQIGSKVNFAPCMESCNCVSFSLVKLATYKLLLFYSNIKKLQNEKIKFMNAVLILINSKYTNPIELLT